MRQSVAGAVNPATGQLVSLIVPHCDTGVFQLFLDVMAREVPKKTDKKVVLVLDNASWHKSKCLNWHHIRPLYLPPYSPDFNPIERFWQHLKSHYLAGYITRCWKELNEKLFDSIKPFSIARKPSVPCAIPIRNNGNYFWQWVYSLTQCQFSDITKNRDTIKPDFSLARVSSQGCCFARVQCHWGSP